MAQNPDVAHLSATLSLSWDGTFAYLVQDTMPEIMQSVEMIVGTEIGERSVVPRFGIDQGVFGTPNPAEIQNACNTYDPRASVNVQVVQNANDTDTVTVAVSAKTGAST